MTPPDPQPPTTGGPYAHLSGSEMNDGLGATVTPPASLLATILASPRDDLPRLVYADALEESGEPRDVARAEFIRRSVTSGLAFYPESVGEPPPYSPDWPDAAGLSWIGRRGFVAEVRTTLAGWCGGECPRCGGQADRPSPAMLPVGEAVGPDGRIVRTMTYPPVISRAVVPCPACSGSGRLPGHGPRLVREQPVEKVVLTDRTPAEDRGVGTVRYLWFRRGHRWEANVNDPMDSAWDVPPLLWPFMPDKGPGTSGCPTREAAMDALSAALLAWARSQPAPGERRGIIVGPLDLRRDYTQDGFAAMEAAGRRLARDRERRVLDAFFGDDPPR